jgi:V8-like Glu-specific endopeptidase
MRFKSLYAAALFAVAWTCQAQVPTRLDYCNADPLSRRVADATALLVPSSQLDYDAVTDTYDLTSLTVFNFAVDVLTVRSPVCPYEPYYNQVRAGQGRTGFLIGPQTLMSASHLPTSTTDLRNFAVIFNWRWIEDGTQPTDSPDRNCKLAYDPHAIPASNVYFPTSSSYNTLDGNANNPADYTILQLDRAVTGVTPLPVRRSGDPLLGDPLLVAGYPDNLPLKLAGGGTVQRIGPNVIAIGDAWTGAGNSGSPVFNLRAQLVESVIARGTSGKIWNYDSAGLCWHTTDMTDFLGYRWNIVDNAPISSVPSNQLPATDALVVSPLNLVPHVVASTTTTNARSSFEVSLPAAAAAAADYTVEVTSILRDTVAGATPVVSLQVQPTAALHTLLPGASQRFDVDAIVPSGVDCDSFDAEVRITPKTPGQYASVIPHRFEVARRDFTVTPDSDWKLTAFQAPYPTRQLTLHNPSPAAQVFNVTTSASWLLAGGLTSTTVNLAAAGSSGDTATLTLSIDPAADAAVPPGTTGTAHVTIAPTNTRCQDRTAEEIDVSFTNGVLELSELDTSGTPLPAPVMPDVFGTPVEYGFKLGTYAGLLVADVDVSVTVDASSVLPLLVNQIPTVMKIDLVTPNPIGGGGPHVMTVWDRDTPTTGYWVEIINDYYEIALDDEVTPPLQPTPLSDADGEDMGGTWKVRLYNSSSSLSIFPYEVKLRVTRAP